MGDTPVGHRYPLHSLFEFSTAEPGPGHVVVASARQRGAPRPASFPEVWVIAAARVSVRVAHRRAQLDDTNQPVPVESGLAPGVTPPWWWNPGAGS